MENIKCNSRVYGSGGKSKCYIADDEHKAANEEKERTTAARKTFAKTKQDNKR